MKTFLIALLTIGLTNLIHSQSQIEKSNLNELATANAITKSLNTEYLNNVNSKDTPVKVMKLQNIAALYKIRESKVYKPNSDDTYEVVFEESNCKIVATYNNEGEIVNTIEEFNNTKLPLKLGITISKEYPEWAFLGNVHTIIYNKGRGTKKTYTVKIKNGSSSKKLKFNLVDKPQTSFVAVN